MEILGLVPHVVVLMWSLTVISHSSYSDTDITNKQILENLFILNIEFVFLQQSKLFEVSTVIPFIYFPIFYCLHVQYTREDRACVKGFCLSVRSKLLTHGCVLNFAGWTWMYTAERKTKCKYPNKSIFSCHMGWCAPSRSVIMVTSGWHHTFGVVDRPLHDS